MPAHRTLYRIYFTCPLRECQVKLQKTPKLLIKIMQQNQIVYINVMHVAKFALTRDIARDKITMVRLRCKLQLNFMRLTHNENRCGYGGIGRHVGFRCCHLSEGFSVPLSLRTSPQTGVAIRSLKAGSPVFINRGSG